MQSLQSELETLWQFHTRRLRPDTPHSQLNDRLVFSQRTALRLARCHACGTLYRNPRERDVRQVYEGEVPANEALERIFASQRNAYRAQARRFVRVARAHTSSATGRGLEIGSYVGGFLAAIDGDGWDFHGIDVNEAAVRYACARGLDATVGTIDLLPGASEYDAVAIWNCLDQLAEPRVVVASAYRLLRDGGLLAVRVPNGAVWMQLRSLLDTSVGPLARALLAYNNLLGFPYLTGFTPRSLGAMLHAEGFDVVLTHGDTLVPLADRWTRRWAAYEERVLKATVRALAPRRMMPWFELYARRR